LNRPRTTTKNTGTKNTASAVPVRMPPITPVPMARWLAEPAPAGDGQRQHAQHEGHRGHDDRAEAQVRGFQRRLDHALALRLQVLGELDDQDGVLGRQADDGDQAHLKYTSLA
jgi:nitric oxide reductase activation protein